MKMVLNFKRLGINDNARELNDLRARLKLYIVLASGLEIQNQQVFYLRQIILILFLHILQL
jgi:hypothetical protein